MFCVTPDGINLNQQLSKTSDDADAQVLAHLQDDDDETGKAISQTLHSHFGGIYQKTAQMDEINLRDITPVIFGSHNER